LDKIRACVADVAAIAKTAESRDLAEGKRRIELLFADADQATMSPLRKSYAISSPKHGG
jgi:hypothetical protein